jgi:Leucine-rich repeat (LRR) protein
MKYIQLFEQFKSDKVLENILNKVRKAIDKNSIADLQVEINVAQSSDLLESFTFYFIENIIGGYDIDMKQFHSLNRNDYDAATKFLAEEIQAFYAKTRAVKLDKKGLKIIPKDLAYTTGVTSLELNHNDISVIPSGVFDNNTNIKFLKLDNNNIKTIPTSIGKLSNVSFLHLGNNPITELPKEIGNCKNLLDLTIAKTNITKLPKELANCKRLMSVWIGSNKITNIAEMKKLMPNCTFDINK